MFILLGRYAREKALEPTIDDCPHCRHRGIVNWKRSYKTIHFFFFPLFSVGDQTTATCGACGYVARSAYPHRLAPKPFLDRLGFVFPLGSLGALALLISILVGVAIANAPPTRPPSAEQVAWQNFEQHLSLGATFGDGDGALVIADTALRSLVDDQGFDKGELAVAVRVKNTPIRQIFIACQYTNLDDVRPKGRRDLVSDLRTAIAGHLMKQDQVVVVVKGRIFHGALGYGGMDGDWSVEVDTFIAPEHVTAAVNVGSAASVAPPSPGRSGN
jgi:hypothetical protein